jgi:hypothetical protein
MVHREARDQAAKALERFLQCETSNEEFDHEYTEIARTAKRQTDRALKAVYGFSWNLYDDFEEHKLDGAYELDEPVRAIAERCVVFLRSDYEYEWRKADFFGIDWRRMAARVLPWIRWEADPLKRFELFMAEPTGEVSVWPFYRREDYVASLRR